MNRCHMCQRQIVECYQHRSSDTCRSCWNALQCDVGRSVADLKTDIQQAVESALAEFERRTGLTPSGINLRMEDSSVIGAIRRFHLADIEIKLGKY